MKKGLDKILDKLDTRDWLQKAFDEIFDKKKRAPKAIDYFYASWAGECPRLIQYMMNAMVHDDIDQQSQRRLDNGNYMHTRYGDYFESINVLKAREPAFKQQLDGVLVSGRGDLVISDDKMLDVLIEMKSINSRDFANIVSAPKEKDFLQWNLCSKALQILAGIILYENKDNQELMYHFVVFDQEKYNKIIDKFIEISECNKNGTLIAKPDICINPKFCSVRRMCLDKKL